MMYEAQAFPLHNVGDRSHHVLRSTAQQVNYGGGEAVSDDGRWGQRVEGKGVECKAVGQTESLQFLRPLVPEPREL